MTIESTLLQSAHNHPLAGKRIYLACSGGRDSMALAWATLRLYQAGKLDFCFTSPPTLIHVHHGLQSANDDWAQLVADWATEHKLPCQIVKVSLSKHDEQSARTARYQAIIEQMAYGDVLMLAHHGNDQAETLLMRLFQGAGLTGLTGIQEWQAWQVKTLNNKTLNNKTIYLWRPWLTITRQAISHYAKHHQLPYVDDPTNIQGKNTRSWLRRQLLPIIEKRYPQLINNLIRSVALLNDVKEIADEVYQQDLQSTVNKGFSLTPYNEVLDIKAVCQLSTARQRQLIHKWLQGNEPLPASKQRIDEILALIHRTDNDQQAELNWQGQHHGYSVRRYRNQLHKLRDDWEQGFQQALLNTNLISIAKEKYLTNNPNLLQNNIINRSINKTDKFALHDKQQPKSDKKLMQYLGIPQWERQLVRVLEIKGNIVCVFTAKQAWFRT